MQAVVAQGPVPTGFTHFAMIAPLAPHTLIVTLGLEPRVQGKRLNTRSGPRFALADARFAGVSIRVGRSRCANIVWLVPGTDRQRVVYGQSVSVRVVLGGCRFITNKNIY